MIRELQSETRDQSPPGVQVGGVGAGNSAGVEVGGVGAGNSASRDREEQEGSERAGRGLNESGLLIRMWGSPMRVSVPHMSLLSPEHLQTLEQVRALCL